ncbi:MAG: tRNA lysidine(34) synthetase TilS [Acidobacteriia bacterium]|nr:tRNA lysidine(34) synthetase TilS [Terriglobia bacterium]
MPPKKPAPQRARIERHGRPGRPAPNDLPRRVLHSLQRQAMLRPGDRVAVAVSGGADSVALLLLLEELRERLGIVLSVAHFNHQLRGKASDADEKFVARLAAARALPFHVHRADVAAEARRRRGNLEDAARRLRYEFFARLVQEGHANRVAVAHTADDQAETVLAHILRGTGLAGLGGIHPLVDHVLRPLLELRREELRAYLRARKQRWREDVTNLDLTRLRARIRRKLLPLLERSFQPAVVAHLTELAERAREDEAFLEALAAERVAALARREEHAVRIRAADLLRPWKEEARLGTEGPETPAKERAATARALSKRLLRRIVASVKQRPGQLTAQHLEALLHLAEHGPSGNVLQLPGGVEARRDLDDVVIRGQSAPPGKPAAGPAAREFAYPVHLGARGATVIVPELNCVFHLRVIDWPARRGETREVAAVLDRNRLRAPLLLRNWRPGDAFRPAGHQRPHKLKRLFLEKRISRWQREGWPVLTSGGAIAWVRGFPVAAEFAPDERTRAGIVIVEESC